ncbi:MAG: HD domain-containing phosphohydrolase [Vicinamibacterales bacterium]
MLIVDDLPSNLALLPRLLSEWNTRTAGSAAEAFSLLESIHPDLILLDIAMPGTDGFEVCRRLKADDRWRDIPVIFMTGLNTPDNETTGLALGAVDYITKPFNAAVVRARVRTHLSLALAGRKLLRQNQELEERVAKRTEELAAALEQVNDAAMETIIRLSRAAEYKDEDTGAHVVRMGGYAAAIAARLSLPSHSVELLRRAAPLHDVGKIGIPDRILLKPGALTPEEFEVIKGHPDLGGRILAGSRSEVIRLGEVLARTHHERWNGTGYPRGLKGTEIPLPGRILAVADTFDALISRRPYKEPFSLEKSMEIVRRANGTWFDPDVVKAFFEAENEILDIKGAYEDRGFSPLFAGNTFDPATCAIDFSLPPDSEQPPTGSAH